MAGYIFLELFVLLNVFLFCGRNIRLKHVLRRDFLILVAVLFVGWFLVDQIAIALQLWSFPSGNTLPIRIFNLPLEEYLLFLIHSLICLCLVRTFHRSEL